MTRRALGAIVALVLVTAPIGACSRELVEDRPAGGGAPVAASLDSARAKLDLASEDPCYVGDARAAWPRCGRWVEEVASTARTASSAAPAAPALTRGAGLVVAGRDAFVARGCTASAAGPAPEPRACVDAVGATREAVRQLDAALHALP